MKVFTIYGFAMLALLLHACSQSKFQKEIGEYSVFLPVVKDTVYYKEYVAEIQSRQNVEIRNRVNGYVDKILVDEGQTVRQGQVLFVISNPHFIQALQKAEALLSSAVAESRTAELAMKNVQALVEKRIVSETELEMSKAKLDAANAKIQEASAEVANSKLNISMCEIKAPFDGVLNRIPYKKGSMVEEGTLLTTLSDNSEVFAYFKVSERDFLDYILSKKENNSSETELILANHQLYSQKGRIETIDGEVDKASGNIAFRARFKNDGNILKNGSSGKIRVATTLRSALIIPQKSTLEIQDKTFVFVLDSANRVELRSFLPKLRLPNFYVVESGITENDKVIFEGIQTLKDGELITPKFTTINENLIAESK
jgi:membrane fusion protein (multidrug efflux system)